MAKILPAINCHAKDTEGVISRVREIEKIFEGANTPESDRWAHFDVADGAFTFYKSWDEPEKIREISPKFQFEAHLMAENPRLVADKWLAVGAKRIILHLETVTPELFAEISVTAAISGAETVLALNPETPMKEVEAYFKATSNFLVLGVHPGLSGQKFLPLVLEKVSALRREFPDGKIEVDGGMNLETGKAAIAAGADSIVSASNIFENSNPEGEYEALRSL